MGHTEVACANKSCSAIVCLLPEQEEKLRRTHETFWCPNGHTNYFPKKTDEEREIARLKKSVERWRADWQEMYERYWEVRRRLRSCPLCGVQLRSRASLVRHLLDETEGHGAGLVDPEAAEAVAAANRRAWPE